MNFTRNFAKNIRIVYQIFGENENFKHRSYGNAIEKKKKRKDFSH
jgi:hypothetical protein